MVSLLCICPPPPPPPPSPNHPSSSFPFTPPPPPNTHTLPHPYSLSKPKKAPIDPDITTSQIIWTVSNPFILVHSCGLSNSDFVYFYTRKNCFMSIKKIHYLLLPQFYTSSFSLSEYDVGLGGSEMGVGVGVGEGGGIESYFITYRAGWNVLIRLRLWDVQCLECLEESLFHFLVLPPTHPLFFLPPPPPPFFSFFLFFSFFFSFSVCVCVKLSPSQHYVTCRSDVIAHAKGTSPRSKPQQERQIMIEWARDCFSRLFWKHGEILPIR